MKSPWCFIYLISLPRGDLNGSTLPSSSFIIPQHLALLPTPDIHKLPFSYRNMAASEIKGSTCQVFLSKRERERESYIGNVGVSLALRVRRLLQSISTSPRVPTPLHFAFNSSTSPSNFEPPPTLFRNLPLSFARCVNGLDISLPPTLFLPIIIPS